MITKTFLRLLALTCSLAASGVHAAVTETDSFQTGPGTATFTPTYTVQPNDLLSGLTPTTIAPSMAAFVTSGTDQDGAGGVPVLTDGSYGTSPAQNPGTPINHPNFAIAGTNAGTSLIYTLASPSTIGSIVTLGGWTDNGRDQQSFSVYTSTGGAFALLDTVSYKPSVGSGIEVATQTILNGFTPIPNVTQIEYVFNDGTNGYQGYNELEAFSSVPEPATWLGGALLLGALGLALRRRRTCVA